MKKRNRLFLENKAEKKKYKGLKEGQARVIGSTIVRHSYPVGSIVDIEEIDGVHIKCSKPNHSRHFKHVQWIHKTDLVIKL
ncbi:hypothetical protein [Bacillus cereus group sp. BfR-BA-00999]|uniref:hypothetical protein n=1 Tax=unclassified Bacillus cereus group TaxID=2750818 RepID=UPI0029C5AC26|nr:hypothetical protein [Bacillus cereus group sp. BfR-BA-00999]MDX5884990.1 hypothetical protein [Bacillus cereus group sp. BfR-BA-00999]